jgi:hypothetical protein
MGRGQNENAHSAVPTIARDGESRSARETIDRRLVAGQVATARAGDRVSAS